MSNFTLIAENLEIPDGLPPFSKSIRVTHPNSPHREAEDILIRFNPLPEAGKELSVLDDFVMVDYLSTPSINKAVEHVKTLTNSNEIGRVILSKLSAGKRIYPHVDSGAYAKYFNRYHLVIESTNCLFRCGEETVSMKTGELWTFDTQQEHELFNLYGDRVHLIMDMK